MDIPPGLGCISRQPMRKMEYKLPLGMRPIPHWSSEIPPCFKITLVYLYISVLFYFKNAFPLCFDSLGQSCSLGCTNRLFNQNQEKKFHVSISLYISASSFFFSRKINIFWIELEIFWETCFLYLVCLLLLLLNKCFWWQAFCSEEGFLLGKKMCCRI